MNLAWWQIILGAIVGLIILVILVVIHELGHAIAAIRNGVEVEEFGIGFPPRACQIGEYKGTKITLNWLPLGGFCKMKGESDDAKEPHSYGAASLWAKTKILLAGVWMNFWTAVVIFAILALFGMPKLVPDQFAMKEDYHGTAGEVSVVEVMKDTVAAHAGVQKGDRVLSINGTKVEYSSEVPRLVHNLAGKELNLVVRRGNADKSFKLQLPAQAAAGHGILGIATSDSKPATIRATWSAPLVGFIDTLQLMWLTIAGIFGMIGNLFTGLWGMVTGAGAGGRLASVAQGVAGPIGILGVIFPTAMASGPSILLYISGMIAVSLAVMNLLPIPGLDGGRCYLTWVYHALKRPLTKEKEEKIVGYGMLSLFGLMILVTLVDVCKLFK